MKVAITGAAGMLGQALVEAFGSHEVTTLARDQLDVTSYWQAVSVFEELKPDWILHAAAFTAVDAAEEKKEEAFRVNALGARNVAAAAHRCGSAMLCFSTDYVFDGKRDGPYPEWAATSPINTYGYSKLVGEEWVQSLCPEHLIVRTSWLYGRGGPNFVDKICARAESGGPLRVVDDQVGSPTLTTDLARHCLLLTQKDLRGICHVTNSDACSWYEFARRIVDCAGLQVEVQPVASSEFKTAARRPANSVLQNWCLETEKLPLMRSWREAVAEYLDGGRG